MTQIEPHEERSSYIKTRMRIERELHYQDVLFNTHEVELPSDRWLSLIMEEVGEVAKEVNEGDEHGNMQHELVQVAALCIQWLEKMELEDAQDK